MDIHRDVWSKKTGKKIGIVIATIILIPILGIISALALFFFNASYYKVFVVKDAISYLENQHNANGQYPSIDSFNSGFCSTSNKCRKVKYIAWVDPDESGYSSYWLDNGEYIHNEGNNKQQFVILYSLIRIPLFIEIPGSCGRSIPLNDVDCKVSSEDVKK